jgi:hypothetical protein
MPPLAVSVLEKISGYIKKNFIPGLPAPSSFIYVTCGFRNPPPQFPKIFCRSKFLDCLLESIFLLHGGKKERENDISVGKLHNFNHFI